MAVYRDTDERRTRLSAAGGSLERHHHVVPGGAFRPPPQAEAPERLDWAESSRPPYDAMLMYKTPVLQTLYDFGDDQAWLIITARLCNSESIAQTAPR